MTEITISNPVPGIYTLPLLTPATCAHLITQASEQDAWQTAGVVKRESHGESEVKTGVRSASLRAFDETTDLWRLLHPPINQTIRPLVKKVWKRDFPTHSPFQVVRYQAGDFYLAHRDTGPHNAGRYFTVVLYLNDNFEGGGTYFPDANFTVLPKTGKALLFPSDFLHQAERVLKGTKYAAVTWFLGAPPVQWI